MKHEHEARIITDLEDTVKSVETWFRTGEKSDAFIAGYLYSAVKMTLKRLTNGADFTPALPQLPIPLEEYEGSEPMELY